MAELSDFTINFGRLKPGRHEFTYQVDASFLSLFEYTSIEKCSTKVSVLIDKTSANLLTFNFQLEGIADLPCDRCLDVLPYSVHGTYHFILKLEDQENNDDDEIVFLHPDSYEINLASYIYDFQVLSLPFKRDCIRGEHPSCKEIERYLQNGSVTSSDDDDDVDPRWNDLKKLL